LSSSLISSESFNLFQSIPFPYLEYKSHDLTTEGVALQHRGLHPLPQ